MLGRSMLIKIKIWLKKNNIGNFRIYCRCWKLNKGSILRIRINLNCIVRNWKLKLKIWKYLRIS